MQPTRQAEEESSISKHSHVKRARSSAPGRRACAADHRATWAVRGTRSAW